MTHFFTFFEIYKIFALSHRSEFKISRKFIIFLLSKSCEFSEILRILVKFREKVSEICCNFAFRAVRKCENRVDLEKSEKNAPFLAIVSVDTAENELRKE